MSDFNKIREDYMSKEMNDIEVQKMKKKIREAKKKKSNRWMAAAAAAVFVFAAIPNISADFAYAAGNIPVLGEVFKAVTFRDYSYDDGKHTAEVKVQGIEGLDDVNSDVKKIADKWVAEFEKGLNGGYENLRISSDIICMTDDYFTLGITCEYISADGYTEKHYYTLDRKTGERITLSSLYDDDSYKEKIKGQIVAQMKAAEEGTYFLEDDVVEITDETEFYINEKGNIVIVFGQGVVGPMSTGTPEFEIER